MDSKRIEELRRLCEAATPGPWIRSKYGFNILTHDSELSTCTQRYTGEKIPTEEEMAIMIANASLIAASREALPQLIDEIERLQAEAAVYREAIEAALNIHDCYCAHVGAIKSWDEYVRTKLRLTLSIQTTGAEMLDKFRGLQVTAEESDEIIGDLRAENTDLLARVRRMEAALSGIEHDILGDCNESELSQLLKGIIYRVREALQKEAAPDAD